MQGPDIPSGLPRLTPPEAGLLTARAHPPDARAVTYIYRRAVPVMGYRVIHRFLVEMATKRRPHGDFGGVIHSIAREPSLRLRGCFRL